MATWRVSISGNISEGEDESSRRCPYIFVAPLRNKISSDYANQSRRIVLRCRNKRQGQLRCVCRRCEIIILQNGPKSMFLNLWTRYSTHVVPNRWDNWPFSTAAAGDAYKINTLGISTSSSQVQVINHDGWISFMSHRKFPSIWCTMVLGSSTAFYNVSCLN